MFGPGMGGMGGMGGFGPGHGGGFGGPGPGGFYGGYGFGGFHGPGFGHFGGFGPRGFGPYSSYGHGFYGGRSSARATGANGTIIDVPYRSDTDDADDSTQSSDAPISRAATKRRLPAFVYYLFGLQRIAALKYRLDAAREEDQSSRTQTGQSQDAPTPNHPEEESTMPNPDTQSPTTPIASPYLPTARGQTIATVIAILALIQGASMIFANIAASHVWQLFGIPFDGGIFIFMVTSAAADIITELFHKDVANRITKWCVIVTLCGGLAVQACEHLPSLPEANNINLAIALGLTTRVCVASAAGFFVGNRINNFVYEVARKHLWEDKYMFQRFSLSTLCGQIFDSLIFNFGAFGGRYGVGLILQQAAIGYFACMVLKVVTTKLIAVPIARHLRRRLER